MLRKGGVVVQCLRKLVLLTARGFTMLPVANAVAMTTLAVHIAAPSPFYNRSFELQSFIIDRRKWDVNTKIRAHITAGRVVPGSGQSRSRLPGTLASL